MNALSIQLPTKRFMLAWLAGIPLTYLALGYLDSFYASPVEILLLAVLLHSLASPFVHYLTGRAKQDFRSQPIETGMGWVLFLALIAFLIQLTWMAGRFRALFDTSLYRLDPDLGAWFAIGISISLPASHWILSLVRGKGFRRTRLFAFVDAHLGGMLLALAFFSIYFLLANIFNQPLFNFDDIFFDTDAKLWRQRFGTELYKDYYERTVHPFVLIVVRPWANLISLFLKGNLLPASFVLIALTGALFVFLVWYFVKKVAANSLYALLIGALFGASASQLIFGSILETYGFLGALALIFIILLLKDAPLWTLAATGLAAFGITISNLAQTVIAHFMVKRDFRGLVKYGLIVAALIVPLNLLNNVVYPDAHPYLWRVDTLQFEEKNVFEITPQRANYLARVMALHSFVAPRPVLFKEDIPFIKVWMFRDTPRKEPLRIGQYDDPFSNFVAYLWAGFLLLGAVFFLKNFLKQDNRFPLAFILILLFNFVLHLRYGRDFFLYSPNWTYAIVLLLALAWRELAGRRWFQGSLLAFILLLLVNNSKLIHVMLTVSVLHVR